MSSREQRGVNPPCGYGTPLTTSLAGSSSNPPRDTAGPRTEEPMRGPIMNREDGLRHQREIRYRIAMHTKSRMNSTETIHRIGCTCLALPLQVITMQYMMKPPAMP